MFSYVFCQDLFPFKWHQPTWVHMYVPPQTKHCSAKPLSFATPLKSLTMRWVRCRSQIPMEFREWERWNLLL